MAKHAFSGNMTRRAFLNVSTMAVAGTALGATLPDKATAYPPCPTPDRPNFLVLLSDDQHYQTLGCVGHTVLQTPHLDALAARGIRFTNSYTASPTCWSSRAGILLGQLPAQHGIANPEDSLSTAQWSESYPALLREAGYHTGYIGKFGVGFAAPRAGFDVFQGLPGDTRYQQRRNGQLLHCTPLLTDQAIDFLHTRPTDRPFCLTVGMKAPHIADYARDPFPAEAAFQTWYHDLLPAISPLHEGRYFEALPAFLQASEGRRRYLHHFGQPKQAREALRNYYRLISGLDAAFGRIQATLENLGLAENTIVIYSADNGYSSGERGLEGKWLPFEEHLRVPLLIADPRNQRHQGARTTHTALNIDLPTTMLAQAGVAIPDAMQGVDLLAATHQDPAGERSWHFANQYDHPGIPKHVGIRQGDWKYVRWASTADAPLRETLFNLDRDPLETADRAQDPACRARLESMRRHLATQTA